MDGASRGRAIPAASRCRASPSPSGGRPLSPPCQEEEEHLAELASAQTLQQPKVSCESSIAATSSSLGSPILVRKPPDWPITFYIRIDLGGSFHTYPRLGGPFQTLQEAENAIDRHLDHLCHPTMCKESLDKLSDMDRLIRWSLYWPDGSRKKCSKSQVFENTRKETHKLVEALVDKYNDDQNLLGDLTYELKDVLHYQTICENQRWYKHFNFTTKTKGADDFDRGIENLFFAELTHLKAGHELAVSCFCMINTNDNGHCYGCTNNGSGGMKHPNNADAYTAGHLNAYLPFGLEGEWDDSDDDVKAEEDRLRRIFKGLDDPDFLDRIFTLPEYATATYIED